MANYRLQIGHSDNQPAGLLGYRYYWICDTDAGKPVTGLNVGDLAYCVDTLKLYVAKSATAWGSTISADYIAAGAAFIVPPYFDGIRFVSLNNATEWGGIWYAATGSADLSAIIQIPSGITGIMAVDNSATSWLKPQTFTGVNNTPTSLSATTTLTADHNTIYATVGVAGITLNLPAAAAATIGRVYYAFKVDTGVGLLTIAPNGTNTLNGVAAAKTIANQFNGCRIQGLSTTGWLVTSFTGL